MRKLVSIVTGVGLMMGTASLALATPSSAADLGNYTVDCVNQAFTSPEIVQASVGDTITVLNNGSANCVVTAENVSISGGTTTLVPRNSVTLTFTSIGLAAVLFTDGYPSYTKGIGFVSLVTGAAASGPPPVLQQFGMPGSGTCDAAQPAGLNWSGVESGGWSPSWAAWANNGNGGAICTRTIFYNSSLSRWMVG